MIECHWGGNAAYGKPENIIALGFVEAFNNKFRIIQRCAYGLRNEEYLKMKILAASPNYEKAPNSTHEKTRRTKTPSSYILTKI